MLHSIDWDKFRLVALVTWAIIAAVRWLRKSVRVRGKQETVRALLRLGTSVLGGTVLAVIPFVLRYWRQESLWFWPMIPGFLIGAITVGVHRNDNLLLYLAVFVNVVVYGGILFACYPHVIGNSHEG